MIVLHQIRGTVFGLGPESVMNAFICSCDWTVPGEEMHMAGLACDGVTRSPAPIVVCRAEYTTSGSPTPAFLVVRDPRSTPHVAASSVRPRTQGHAQYTECYHMNMRHATCFMAESCGLVGRLKKYAVLRNRDGQFPCAAGMANRHGRSIGPPLAHKQGPALFEAGPAFWPDGHAK
jgi:hypothetical protein